MVRLAWHEGGSAEPGFAHLPDRLCLLAAAEELGVDRPVPVSAQIVEQRLGLLDRFGFARAAELDEQPAAALGEELEAAGVEADLPVVVGEHIVEALAADRPVREHGLDLVARLGDVAVAGDE